MQPTSNISPTTSRLLCATNVLHQLHTVTHTRILHIHYRMQVRSCDEDADRLDKGEFRRLLRGLGGGSSEALERPLLCRDWISGERTSLAGRGCSNREIDTYFATIDTDKSGSLDVNEVRQ